jgi:hypothetical protein
MGNDQSLEIIGKEFVTNGFLSLCFLIHYLSGRREKRIDSPEFFNNLKEN